MNVWDLLLGGSAKDRFARQVAARYRERGWPGEVRYDAEAYAIHLGDGVRTYLHRLFEEWRATAPRRRPGFIDRIVDVAFEGPQGLEPFDEISDRLLPTVRNRSHIENQWLFLGYAGGEDDAAQRPFCEDLTICIGVDRPNSLAIANGRAFLDWSRSFDEALPIALENLRAISPSRFERQAAGFYVSDYGDWHDSARVLLPHVFEALALKGEAVAVPVTRSGLVVAGSEDIPALDAMAAFVETQIHAETRPTAYLPIILRDGAWRAVEPDMPLPASIHRLRTMQRLWDYGEQTLLLEEHFQNEKRPVFVAPLEACERGDRIGTWTSWTFEIPTLLPQADAVILNLTMQGPAMARSWTDIQAACGPWQAEPNLHPPRFLVEGPPSPAQIAVLEAAQAPDWLRFQPAQ